MNSSASPIRSIVSSVLGCTTRALESCELSVAFSTIRTSTPRRASSPATMRPTGDDDQDLRLTLHPFEPVYIFHSVHPFSLSDARSQDPADGERRGRPR